VKKQKQTSNGVKHSKTEKISKNPLNKMPQYESIFYRPLSKTSDLFFCRGRKMLFAKKPKKSSLSTEFEKDSYMGRVP